MYAESFASEGFKVWWDAALHSGETFDEVIERELRSAKAVVVLWSTRSVASRWVRAEATLADRNDKLVPVIIEPCNRPIIFELTHAADMSDWKGDKDDPRWGGLVKDIARLAGPREKPKPEVTDAEPAAAVPPVAKAADQPAAKPQAKSDAETPAPEPAKPEAKAVEPPPSAHDELLEALDRLSRSKGSGSLDAGQHEDALNFFKRADEFRRQEGEKVHCLRWVRPDGTESIHIISTPAVKIGRTAPADIVVAEPGVSRQHCVVEFAADKLRVTDLNSTNGTYIDNKRIAEPSILEVGSVLRVGNISFEHEVHSRAEVEEPHGVANLNLDPSARAARIARPS